jgi:hypothetical protein
VLCYALADGPPKSPGWSDPGFSAPKGISFFATTDYLFTIDAIDIKVSVPRRALVSFLQQLRRTVLDGYARVPFQCPEGH